MAAHLAIVPRRLSTIGTLCALYGATHRAIRFYEEIGLIEAVRSPTSTRLFDEGARRRVEWITRLRAVGVSLRDIREILEFDQNSEDPAGVRRRAIEKIAARTKELKSQIAAGDDIARALRQELALLPGRTQSQIKRVAAK